MDIYCSMNYITQSAMMATLLQSDRENPLVDLTGFSSRLRGVII